MEESFRCKACGEEFPSKEALSSHILSSEELWLKVESEMERLGLSQAELSRRSGVSAITVSRIIGNHTKNPRMSDIVAIAHALNRSVDWFCLNLTRPEARLDASLVEFFNYGWPKLTVEEKNSFRKMVRLFLESSYFRELQEKLKNFEES